MARRSSSRIPEQVRGVGYVVGLGLGVFLVGLAGAALFVWLMT
jgi:hypothetical protein